MLQANVQAQGVRNSLTAFDRDRRPRHPGEILVFEGTDGLDVYNPSIPFESVGRTVIAGRVESRDSEKSKTMFFEPRGTVWAPVAGAPSLPLQDPFVSFFRDGLVLGGVNVTWDGDRLVEYHTDFYKGKDIFHLELFLSGPTFMKDVRLLELPDGRVAVFSRPQGQPMLDRYGCIAKIGFAIAPSLDSVTADFIEGAPLLEGHFLPDEWGGSNQPYNLKNGLVGVIGHESWGETVDGVFYIHYYSMAFAIDPETRSMTPSKVIGTRDCFPAGPQKDKRSQDVVFTSGILRRKDGKALLYCGLSDCQVGCLEIDDPFLAYETL